MSYIANPTYSAPFRGALVKKVSDQVGANYVAGSAIAWDTEDYDTSSIHDNVTNNTRLTVPAGVTKVRLSGQVRVTAHTADNFAHLTMTKNGASFTGEGRMSNEIGATAFNLQVTSGAVTVTGGDYFELVLQVEADTAVDISQSLSWFQMEIIE